MSKNTLQSSNKAVIWITQKFNPRAGISLKGKNKQLFFMFWGIYDYLLPLWGMEYYTSLQY